MDRHLRDPRLRTLLDVAQNVSSLRELGLRDRSGRAFEPPFILEKVVDRSKCIFQYVVLEEAFIYFFRIVWDTLDLPSLLVRRVLLFQVNTIACEDGIVLYFKERTQRFFVTTQSSLSPLSTMRGEYSVKGYDAPTAEDNRRLRARREESLRRHRSRTAEPSVDHVLFRFASSREPAVSSRSRHRRHLPARSGPYASHDPPQRVYSDSDSYSSDSGSEDDGRGHSRRRRRTRRRERRRRRNRNRPHDSSDSAFSIPLHVCNQIPFLRDEVARHARHRARDDSGSDYSESDSNSDGDSGSSSCSDGSDDDDDNERAMNAILEEYRSSSESSSSPAQNLSRPYHRHRRQRPRRRRRRRRRRQRRGRGEETVIELEDSRFSRQNVELARRVILENLDLSHYFFEEFRRSNCQFRLFQSLSGFSNCCLIILNDSKLFFYYRDGDTPLKVLTVIDYYVVGGLEVETKIGSFIFMHDSCRCFFLRKYRKLFRVRNLEAVQFDDGSDCGGGDVDDGGGVGPAVEERTPFQGRERGREKKRRRGGGRRRRHHEEEESGSGSFSEEDEL